MENKRTILVPWDFSQVAEYALEHAVKFANIINTDMALIHIVKKEKDVVEATQKLETVADVTEDKYKIRPKVIVREGTIFNTISDAASELNAEMVIMGTHGIKGMQKFTGSWALKVIAGTKAPFLVVQDSPRRDTVNNILFPVDFKSEDKEKLAWAYYLSKYYQTKLLICKADVNDSLIRKKTTQNLNFTKKYLDERNIDYEITTIEGTSSLSDATLKYAKDIEVDLILIMTTKEPTLQDYILGAEEQKIIANPLKIPVMCINPRTDLKRAIGFNG